MFATLTQPAPDPILGIAERFAADPSASKVDLGIGIYKDKFGKAPVLYCVKRAEAWLLDQQDSKAYLSSAGNELYNACTIATRPGHARSRRLEAQVRCAWRRIFSP